MWIFAFVKRIPGILGCVIRNRVMPYESGVGVTVWDGVHIEKPSGLRIGDRTTINRGSVLNCEGRISIGADVLIGPNVTLYSQNHRYDRTDVPINQQGYERKPVRIGDGAWLAAGVTVLPGVTIGEGAVIGAASVVTRDVPAGALAVGSPAVVRRMR